jgi:hypothetical protein
MKVLPHVMRNINEFNIPSGNSSGYEILYFGVNLILMFDYRLAFDIEVKNSDNEIQVLILSRRDIPAWKENDDSSKISEINLYYSKSGLKINDVYKPIISDAYAFVLNNRKSSISHEAKTVEVTLIHNWQQEVKESQLRDYYREE